MRLVYHSDSAVYLTDLRSLAPGTNNTAKLVKRQFDVSALFTLLGCRAENVDGRLADVAAIGIDWAYATVGRDLQAGSARVNVTDAVEVVRDALIIRERDVDVLDRATVYLAGEDLDVTSKRTTDLMAELTRLMVGRVVAARGVHLAFETDDLIAAAAFELISRAHGAAAPDEIILANRCRHCGALFATRSRVTETYCRRLAPGEPVGGRTCAVLGPLRKFEDTRSPLQAKYRAEYKRLFLRHQRGAFTREVLDAWRSDARHLLILAGDHDWTEDRYSAELAQIAPKEEGS